MPALPIVDLPHSPSVEISIDSRADESFWREAYEASGFTTYQPLYGEQPTTEVTARLFSDNNGLYVHWSVLDPEPSLVRARYQRRDNIWKDDTVGIYVDTNGDAQRGYLFICNPFGAQADAVRVPGSGDSFGWDERWHCNGRLTETGFEVEMMIPWNAVRHPVNMEEIGISLLSSTSRNRERASWPVRHPDVSGILIQQSMFRGPSNVEDESTYTIAPDLVVSRLDLNGGRFAYEGVSPGLTVTVSPNDTVSILGTLNPDFSTVESDEFQIESNNRFALYLKEKRPFFTEGSEWLEFGVEDLIYTRSMVAPIAGIRADFEQNDIRLSTLSVIDRTPSESVTEGNGWTEDDIGESTSVSSILRGRRALGPDGYTGAIVSHKSIVDSDLTNLVAGADARIRVNDQASLSGALVSSRTALSDGEIIADQAGFIGTEWENSDYKMSMNFSAIGPNFRSENGYVPQSDVLEISSTFWRNYYTDNNLLTKFEISPYDASVSWHTDGRLKYVGVGPMISTRLANNMFFHLFGGYSGELYEEEWLDNGDVGLFFGGLPSQRFGFHLSLSGGTTSLYDEDDPRSVRHFSGAGGAAVALGRQLTITGSFGLLRLSDPGILLELDWVSRLQAEYFFTQQIWVRANFDFSGDDSNSIDKQAMDALMGWELTPGKALYLGVGNPELRGEDWQVFAKASWLFD